MGWEYFVCLLYQTRAAEDSVKGRNIAGQSTTTTFKVKPLYRYIYLGMEGLDVSHQGADVAKRSSALRALFSLPVIPAPTAAENTTTAPTSNPPR